VTDPGLCARCLHSKTVRGARSEFWMCERARLDPRFPRYPRLPVMSCVGFEAARDPESRALDAEAQRSE